MRRLAYQGDLIIGFIIFLFSLICSSMFFIQVPNCRKKNDKFLNEVIAYDRIGVEIRRRDAFIAGKMIHDEKVPLLIGVPTVYRSHKNITAFYLGRTIKSLLEPLTTDDRKQIMILIILADSDEKKKTFIYKKINELFPKEIRSGLIGTIGIPKRFYLSLHDLPSTFNDTTKRMFWRSKQSLDYTFIFQYVQNMCDYYLQIEDDVLANDQYFDTLMEDISRLNNVRNKEAPIFRNDKETRLKYKPWLVSEYYKMGFIGRLIPSQYLPLFAGFIKVFYTELPVDWGYSHMMGIMGTYKPNKNPALFKHIGKQSSSLGT